MDKTKHFKQDEIVSMNDNLNPNFHMQELEERLETDPFLVGGLYDSYGDGTDSAACLCIIQICNKTQNNE